MCYPLECVEVFVEIHQTETYFARILLEQVMSRHMLYCDINACDIRHISISMSWHSFVLLRPTCTNCHYLS